jgi:hypothetical protein
MEKWKTGKERKLKAHLQLLIQQVDNMNEEMFGQANPAHFKDSLNTEHPTSSKSNARSSFSGRAIFSQATKPYHLQVVRQRWKASEKADSITSHFSSVIFGEFLDAVQESKVPITNKHFSGLLNCVDSSVLGPMDE